MAKKDTDNFDFEVEGEGKAKAGLNLDFIKNLTKQQKGIILAALIGIVLVIAIIVVVIIAGVNNSITGGNTNPGGDNSQTGTGNGGDSGDGNKELPSGFTEFSVLSLPIKTTYYVGEEADYAGLIFLMKKDGERSENISYSEYSKSFTITGFDSSTPAEEQVITVTYGDLSDTFTITIIPQPTSKATLVSITVDPLPKTTYRVGEAFSASGGYLVCEYSDGTTETVPLKNKYISGYGAIAYTPGEHQIKVKYADDHGGYAETYITVTIVE